MKKGSLSNPFASSKRLTSSENAVNVLSNPFSAIINESESNVASVSRKEIGSQSLASPFSAKSISSTLNHHIESNYPVSGKKRTIDNDENDENEIDENDHNENDDTKENIDPLSFGAASRSKLQDAIKDVKTFEQMKLKAKLCDPKKPIWQRITQSSQWSSLTSLKKASPSTTLNNQSNNTTPKTTHTITPETTPTITPKTTHTITTTPTIFERNDFCIKWDWTVKKKIMFESKTAFNGTFVRDVQDSLVHYHQYPLEPLNHHESRVLGRALAPKSSSSSMALAPRNEDEKLDFASCHRHYIKWKQAFQSLYNQFGTYDTVKSSVSDQFYFYWNHGTYTFLFVSRGSTWNLSDKFVLVTGLDNPLHRCLEKEGIEVEMGLNVVEPAMAEKSCTKPESTAPRHSSFTKRDFGSEIPDEDEDFELEVQKEIEEYLSTTATCSKNLKRQSSLPVVTITSNSIDYSGAPSFLASFVSDHAKAKVISGRSNIHLLYDYLLNRKDFTRIPQFPTLISKESFHWSSQMVNRVEYQSPPERLVVLSHPIFHSCSVEGLILPSMQYEILHKIQDYHYNNDNENENDNENHHQNEIMNNCLHKTISTFKVNLEWNREFLMQTKSLLNEDEKSVSHLPLKKIEIQDGIILSQEYAGTANEDKKEDKKKPITNRNLIKSSKRIKQSFR